MVQLIIEKVPRQIKSRDIPIDFPPLENLHLELIENAKKLKKGLPLIPIKLKEPKEIENLQKKLKHTISDTSQNSSKEPQDLVFERNVDPEFLKDVGEPEETGSINEEQFSQEAPDDIEEDDEEMEEEDPYAGMTPEEREAAEKEEYLWRFRILRRKHRNANIPQYNEHSDLRMMKLNYDRTVKDLMMDQTVNQYRTYLTLGFVAIEWVGTQMLSIDLRGFSKQQAVMMDSYDALLVELGEKRQETWTSNLPVEIRLLGMIIMQAVIFYAGKVISSNYGGQIADIFQGLTGRKVDQKDNLSDSYQWTSTQNERPRKKMRGPRVKPRDIKTDQEGD